MKSFLSPIEEIVTDLSQGKMVVIVDDEKRENEGDLIFCASSVSAEKINFMAKFARGLICLALDKKRFKKMKLKLMTDSNKSRHRTAFTVSIEAKKGVTTGISAQDRSQTIKVAVSSHSKPSDLVSPGHIFPLLANDGGVLVRAGHTEAAVDLARMATNQKSPYGVICEIMNDDGSMARRDDLVKFAQKFGLAFQIRDDILDVIGEEKDIGKPVGSDESKNKSTYASILGVPKSQEKAEKLSQEAINILKSLPYNTQKLQNLSNLIVERIR